MKKEKTLFLVFLFVLGALFLLCGYSLVRCFVYNTFDDNGDPSILEIIYLFIHLVIIAIVFYLAFRAYKIKSSIVYLLTTGDNDEKKTLKSRIISGILSGIFLTIGFYSMLHIFGVPCPPLNYLSMSFAHDFMNAGYFFGSIALVFFIYPFIADKNQKAE